MKEKIYSFINKARWGHADIQWFSADWSTRNYARLIAPNGNSAILLISPPDNSPKAMIGHELGKWVKINKHFKDLKLNTPSILAEDLKTGLILMEDFGNETIANKGITSYIKATEVLINMRDAPNALDIELIQYEDSHVYQALRFFPQYLLKNINDTASWFTAWKEIEASLAPCPRALTHMDYHAANLMWKNEEIGIIDFQAACNGPFVYDIVNLLEDIRHSVPENIKKTCKSLYCATLSDKDKELFNHWYPIITAQFYARILGQIQYLAVEKNRQDLMKYYDFVYKTWENLLHLPQLRPILQITKET